MTLRLGSSPTPACESGSPEAIASVERVLAEICRRRAVAGTRGTILACAIVAE